MRTDVKVATISLAMVLGACSTREEKPTGLSEDLKKDLAVASASAGDLATAPNAFKPAQVVSSVEMTRSKTPVPRLVASKRRTPKTIRAEAVKHAASDVVANPEVKGTEADAPTPTPVAINNPTESAPVAVVEQPTPEPTPVSTTANTGRGEEGRGEGSGGIGESGRGEGRGRGIGGIIGVVIRGGIGGVDKCDPRTDGRRRRGGIFGGMGAEEGIGRGGGIIPIGRGTFPTRL
jgi:hypothetical protein